MSFMSKIKDTKTKKPLCLKCGLSKNGCLSPKMKHTGMGNKKILIITPYPNNEEDVFNSHLKSHVGRFLELELNKQNIDIFTDCWRIHTVNCLPLDKDSIPIKKPTTNHIKYCRPYMEQVIIDLAPEKIILITEETSLKSFYSHRIKRLTASKSRGLRFHDSIHNCFVYPISLKSIKEQYNIAATDIKNALEDRIQFKKERSCYETTKILTDIDEIIQVIDNIRKNKTIIAFDYEATSIKPFLNKTKLLSISITIPTLETYTFLIDHKYNTKEDICIIKHHLKLLIEDPDILKVVAGYSFEYSWSCVHLKAKPEGFYWDTQLCSHVLDNRKGITGLKFDIFRRFGIEDYDHEINAYIRSGETLFNRMEELSPRKLLKYNGVDSYGTMKLYLEQKKELIGNLRKAYKFFIRSMGALVKMHLNGFAIDLDYYKEQQRLLSLQIEELHRLLLLNKFAKKFESIHGRPIDIDALNDLKELLFKIIGCASVKKTKKGNDALDIEALTKIDHPFGIKLLQYRKLEKLRNTYIHNIIKETHNGIMNPFFNLSVAVTYRSSSSGINFQFLPKRDKTSMTCIRKGILPFPGCVLIEGDFSGAEVMVGAAFHKDPNYIRFLSEPGADMHKHISAKAFITTEDNITKIIRGICKGITFGFSYGGFYEQIGPLIYDLCINELLKDGTPVREHLDNNGIYSRLGFTEHIATVQSYFWDEMFPIFAQWRRDIYTFYLKHGYIETPFGFRFTDIMDSKQASNFIVQGSSFHLLLDLINTLLIALKKYKMKTKLSGQIHDAVVSNTPIKEIPTYIELVSEITYDLHKKHSWLVLPMEIEFDISKSRENGGNFAEMEKYALV